MMDVLERYYPNAGTFGLFDGGVLKTPASSEVYEISPATISSGANLEDGELVYYMESGSQVVPVEPDDPDNPENPCPDDTKAFFIFGQWYCQPLSAFCAANTVFNPNLGRCCDYGQIVNSDGECEDEEDPCTCSSGQTPVVVDNECLCLQPQADMDCGELEPWLNYETLTWECPEIANLSSASEDCKQQLLLTKMSGASATLRRPVSPCNSCEKTMVDADQCKIYCVPDATKWDSRSCWVSSVASDECNGERRGAYFAFSDNSGRLEFEVETDNRSTVSINVNEVSANYQLRDRKFHCMECEFGLDTDHSVFPFIAVCKNNPLDPSQQSQQQQDPLDQ